MIRSSSIGSSNGTGSSSSSSSGSGGDDDVGVISTHQLVIEQGQTQEMQKQVVDRPKEEQVRTMGLDFIVGSVFTVYFVGCIDLPSLHFTLLLIYFSCHLVIIIHNLLCNFYFDSGYPKCGTTSLLYAFNRHNQTVMPHKEVCSFNSGTTRGITRMQQALDKASIAAAATESKGSSNVTKHGIKCPLSVWHTLGLQRLAHFAPNVKLIIGVRHPISFFQSYYNYRITSMHDKGKIVEVPPAESLIGIEHQWKDVSTDIVRFELGLMQLGKVELSEQQQRHLLSKGRQMAKLPFQIFLYSIEQLEDTNGERASAFRGDMQRFLGLDGPITFTRENINHFVGAKKHPETIDVCEPSFDSLRALMVTQGNATKKWILEKFIKSDDVTVGGSEEHFGQLLSAWGSDPCH